MILLLQPGAAADGPEVKRLCQIAGELGLGTWVHEMAGATRKLVEVHLLGATATVPVQTFAELPFVERVIRVSQRYRLLGRHDGQSGENWQVGFQYRGLTFDQEQCHVFAGLCAVDNRESVDQTFAALERVKLRTARMGAYKPRTSPYDFQGHGAECLPYVFELAGKYGIKIIAMEVTHESHIAEIQRALHASGNATGVMLQIGTRNAQNFELLKAVGAQTELPVLFKRGMGITLEESLNACEYVASGGNRRIVFGLRGMKTNLGDPHRNFVDFAHVPVVKRLTRLPVCIDPSHSVGRRSLAPDGLYDIFHVTAQAVIAGCNLILVDVHPQPKEALCDGPQALTLDELPGFLEDVAIVRRAYEERLRRVAERRA
jgi:3-deoxy-7-phosphoheptulonate synthase